jgi:rubrerythrin
MERDSYLDGIRSAWLGEQFGEVFFRALAGRTNDESMRSKWQALAELENVTGKRMAAILEAYGEVAVTDENIEVGEEVLSQYADASHLDAMMRMKELVEKAIIRFDQLLAVAPESDVAAVQFLVRHEQALLTFVDREIGGDPAHALEAVEKLL